MLEESPSLKQHIEVQRINWAVAKERLLNRKVAFYSQIKSRPGLPGRRRRLVKIRFKHTLIWQQKVARRLAIYEDMKLKAMASHIEVVSQHIEKTTDQPNDVLIFKPSETDTKTGDLLIRQPKVRDVLVQLVVTDIEERAQRVWHKLTTKE